jgi:hypothetical protein
MEEVSSRVDSNGWATPSWRRGELGGATGWSGQAAFGHGGYDISDADIGRSAEEDDYEACAQRVAADVRRRLSEFYSHTAPLTLWTELAKGAVTGTVGGLVAGPGALVGFLTGTAAGAAAGLVEIYISLAFSKELDVDRMTLQECGKPPRRRNPS